MHDRAGEPEAVFAACLLTDDRRAWATSTDRTVAGALCEGEWVGRQVQLDQAGTLRQ